jgi:hypothetical protein
MSLDVNKAEVLNFFDNYILKYIVKDLEALDLITADVDGRGGCAIPQSTSAFSALDLVGYLIHTQDMRVVGMSFSEFLGNVIYFPSIHNIVSQQHIIELIRDDIRSVMAHRFALSLFQITKEDNGHLLYEEDGKYILSASHLTKLTIKAINQVYLNIFNDSFVINGFTHEQSIQKIKTKIDKLKAHVSIKQASISGLYISTTSTNTTSSFGV